MRRVLGLLFFLPMVSWCAGAQDSLRFDRPDFATIERLSTDPESPFCYDTLMERYMGNDTTMTEKEMQMLYYGRLFALPTKGSVVATGYKDSIQAVYHKDSVTDVDRQSLIRYYTQAYSAQPTNLEVLLPLFNLHSYFHDDEAPYFLFKLRTLVNLILSTGSGISAEEAIYVNSVPDEYAILSILELEFAGTQRLIGVCDYLEVRENDYKLEGVYFNVEQLLKGYERMLSPKDKKQLHKRYNKLKRQKKKQSK